MKKILLLGVLAGAVLFARCPQGELKCEYDDGYSIMEAESASYGPHNWMEMQHHYADFSKEPCSRCGEAVYKDIKDRTIDFVD